ncbi:MAG: HDIG domain-containing protein [Anaerosomatales bacterium]|nr:HDIG domain-containing protein [Anaerosomatales bacterium]MDT8433527.1 HDIG domain-containing protein [Anaerosomatales bacterium]
MGRLSDLLRRVRPSAGRFGRRRIRRAILAVSTAVLVTFPLVLQTPPVGLVEGEPAPRTFRANRTVQFVDEEATDFARTQAAASVESVTVFDPGVVAEARGDVAATFELLRLNRPLMSEEPTVTVQSLFTRFPQYEQEWVEALLEADELEFGRAERAAEQLATTVLTRRFDAQEKDAVLEQLRESAGSLALARPVREAVAGMVEQSVRPTLTVDEAATEAARTAAAEGIDPVVIIKLAGENIVQRGEIVTAEQLEIIRRLGLLDQGGSLQSLLALMLLAGIAAAAAVAYMWRFERAVFDNTRDLALISVLIVGALWTTRAILWFFPEVSVYLLPVPLTAMLATVLINARIGLVTAVVTAVGGVLLGFTGGSSMVAMLVWSTLSVVAMSFMTQRSRLFYVGMFLVGSGASLAWLATLAAGAPPGEALSAAANGALGGLFSAVLGYGLLPFFETVFRVTTDIRLLELASPGHPLMRRLMVEAPGTYSHSVITGNLAEAGAEAIGANPLLARVGAYYHDVGKIRRPGFFVENQAGADNPHDETTPSLSAIIITAHVREGLELAREHRLPPEIIDIIEQHHGDSLVSYFYNKATQSEGSVAEADYRYAFSRPQSREAALVMLADSAEAAVRAVKKPTLPRVEAAVRRVVDGKVADGQLHDSDLTLADVDRIVQVYSTMLVSIYHPRIEYPEAMPRRSEYAN